MLRKKKTPVTTSWESHCFFFSLNNFGLKTFFLSFPLFYFLFVDVHKDLITFMETYHKGPIAQLLVWSSADMINQPEWPALEL